MAFYKVKQVYFFLRHILYMTAAFPLCTFQAGLHHTGSLVQPELFVTSPKCHTGVLLFIMKENIFFFITALNCELTERDLNHALVQMHCASQAENPKWLPHRVTVDSEALEYSFYI